MRNFSIDSNSIKTILKTYQDIYDGSESNNTSVSKPSATNLKQKNKKLESELNLLKEKYLVLQNELLLREKKLDQLKNELIHKTTYADKLQEDFENALQQLSTS